MIVVSLEYGPEFSGPGKDVFWVTGEPSEAHTSNFLHPVFYYYEFSPSEYGNLDHLIDWDLLSLGLMNHEQYLGYIASEV